MYMKIFYYNYKTLTDVYKIQLLSPFPKEHSLILSLAFKINKFVHHWLSRFIICVVLLEQFLSFKLFFSLFPDNIFIDFLPKKKKTVLFLICNKLLNEFNCTYLKKYVYVVIC